jgi:uncharacterized protein with GYD domain
MIHRFRQPGAGGFDVAKMLWHGTYSTEGVKGLMKEGGTGRRKAVEELVASAGGKLEAVYWAFGDHDVYLIADLPDNATAAGLSLAVAAAGAVQLKTVVLLTAEEMDAATKKSLTYRPPGA